MAIRHPESRLQNVLRYAAVGAAVTAPVWLALGPLPAMPVAFLVGALAARRTRSLVGGLATVTAGLVAASLACLLEPSVAWFMVGGLAGVVFGCWFVQDVRDTWRRGYERAQEAQARYLSWHRHGRERSTHDDLIFRAYAQFPNSNPGIYN